MNMQGHENSDARRRTLFEAVDRHGPHPGTWPDLARAARAREAMLADRDFRAYRDGAVNLNRGLATAARALDAEIADAKAMDRIMAAVAARTTPAGAPRRHLRHRAAAAAAVIVLAAALGGMVDSIAPPFAGGDGMQVVQLDTLVFGPTEGDF